MARTMMTRKSDSFHSYQKLVNVTSVDISAGRRKWFLFKQKTTTFHLTAFSVISFSLISLIGFYFLFMSVAGIYHRSAQ